MLTFLRLGSLPPLLPSIEQHPRPIDGKIVLLFLATCNLTIQSVLCELSTAKPLSTFPQHLILAGAP